MFRRRVLAARLPPAFADCRPSSVTDGTDTFAYAYQPGGDLIRTVTKSGTPALVAARAYEPTRDVLANIGNKAGPVVKSSYTCTVNSLGQRTNPLQAYSDWGKRIYHTQEEFDRAQQTSSEVAYEATRNLSEHSKLETDHL